MLGETSVAIPEGTAKELLPGFTDSGWEFKAELFWSVTKNDSVSIILSRIMPVPFHPRTQGEKM